MPDVDHALPILVAEDDAAVTRFILEALSRLELEADCFPTVKAAAEAATKQRYALVITDLMFPDGSGLDLIQGLNPKLQGTPRVVVFSAGIYQAMRNHLLSIGVHQCLSKPSSIAELVQVIRDALGFADWPEAPRPSLIEDRSSLQPFELAAIEECFDGDRDFYVTFRATCIRQFTQDIRAGDDACARGDQAALSRVAHSLKSVLQTLGFADHAICAQAVERAGHQAPWEEALAGWAELRGRMIRSFDLPT